MVKRKELKQVINVQVTGQPLERKRPLLKRKK